MHKRLTREEQTSAKVAARRGAKGPVDAHDAAGMKTCPCCHATCFADMEVCYGCLHAFEGDALPVAAKTVCEEAACGEVACDAATYSEAPRDDAVTGVAKARPKSTQESEALAKKEPSPLGGGEGSRSWSGVEFVKILELSIGLRIAHDGKGRISAEITDAEEGSR